MSHSTCNVACCRLGRHVAQSRSSLLDSQVTREQPACSVDLKELVEKIGNALFQECLVWKYEVRVGEHSGGGSCSLQMVLCDVDATELEILGTADHVTHIATFYCAPRHPALNEVCRQLRVDLGQNDDHPLVDDSVSTNASAIDAFLEAISAEVVRLGGRDSGASTIRLSSFPLDEKGKRPTYEA